MNRQLASSKSLGSNSDRDLTQSLLLNTLVPNLSNESVPKSLYSRTLTPNFCKHVVEQNQSKFHFDC